ncbi:MAG: protein-glutamate O-methyltransferase CheR [Myxococcales bacterium]|nr:protein-glutamate O-methyltransferase CheR [Myxococcales bacterium]
MPSIKPYELTLLDAFIARHLGLHFAEHRRDVLVSRLGKRVESLRLSSFMDYYLLLELEPNGELSELARILTNNETYFFRETQQFDALFGPGLDALRAGATALPKLRLLSAGCSSGEEPYSLGIFARENLHRMWGTEVQIDAFDIDEERLEVAARGTYAKAALRNLTPEQCGAYFENLGAERYRLKPGYRQGVRFAPGNIVALASYARGAPYDAVFCRNVLIYFSEASLRLATSNFARVLRPGGLLFLGHSESIIGLSDDFEPMRLDDHIVYRRVGA